MRITRKKLQKIISEEMQKAIKEAGVAVKGNPGKKRPDFRKKTSQAYHDEELADTAAPEKGDRPFLKKGYKGDFFDQEGESTPTPPGGSFLDEPMEMNKAKRKAAMAKKYPQLQKGYQKPESFGMDEEEYEKEKEEMPLSEKNLRKMVADVIKEMNDQNKGEA